MCFNFTINGTLFETSVNGTGVPEEERKGYEWLRERENLEDIDVVGAMYRGPRILEK